MSLAEITAFESTPLMEQVLDQLRGLTPQNNSQRQLLAHALQIAGEIYNPAGCC